MEAAAALIAAKANVNAADKVRYVKMRMSTPSM
jgi:hypothetical protein